MEDAGNSGIEETNEALDLERRQQAVEASEAEESQPPEGVFAAQYKSHSGPLPDHDWFAGLETIHPGATKIILRDFTEERQHQRQMQGRAIALDAQVLSAFSRYQQAQLWMAGGLALFLAGGGLALIFFDKAIHGFILLISEIAVLVGVFLARRTSEDDELEHLDEEDIDRLMAEMEQEDEDGR